MKNKIALLPCLLALTASLAFAGQHFDKAYELYKKGPSAANEVIIELELELGENPENEQALLLLAIAQRGMAKFDDSLATLKKVEAIYEKKEKMNPQLYMLVVENYYFKKDYKKTKELLAAYRAIFQTSEDLKAKGKALSEAVEKALARPEASGQDDAQEQYDLGLAFLMRGTPKDISEAFKHFQKAAERGHVHAQYNLAYMYKMGQGTPRDLPAAFKWYQKAADLGYAWAQHSLALMYRAGEGTAQDLPAAFAWFKKAAEQDDSKSQYNLAGMYYNGSGVSKDEAEALAWLYTARQNKKKYPGSSENEINSFIKTIEKKLPKKSIREAQQRAKQIQAGIAAR